MAFPPWSKNSVRWALELLCETNRMHWTGDDYLGHHEAWVEVSNLAIQLAIYLHEACKESERWLPVIYPCVSDNSGGIMLSWVAPRGRHVVLTILNDGHTCIVIAADVIPTCIVEKPGWWCSRSKCASLSENLAEVLRVINA